MSDSLAVIIRHVGSQPQDVPEARRLSLIINKKRLVVIIIAVTMFIGCVTTGPSYTLKDPDKRMADLERRVHEGEVHRTLSTIMIWILSVYVNDNFIRDEDQETNSVDRVMWNMCTALKIVIPVIWISKKLMGYFYKIDYERYKAKEINE